jgi:hypothetical protein
MAWLSIIQSRDGEGLEHRATTGVSHIFKQSSVVGQLACSGVERIDPNALPALSLSKGFGSVDAQVRTEVFSALGSTHSTLELIRRAQT